jgi:hypothetical protein
MNYSLWWHCTSGSRNVAQVEAQCGGLPVPAIGQCATNANGMKCLAVNETQQSIAHTYSTPGFYISYVIGERGGWADSGGVAIRVNAGITHSECVSSACVIVGGAGPNRCSSSSDCSGTFRGVCDAAQRACVNQAGGGASTCNTDPLCGGVTNSHLECQNNACVIVGGAGANQGGCSTIGASCGVLPPSSCNFKALPTVIREGSNSTLSWNCGSSPNCTIRNASGTQIYSGVGPSTQVTPSQTTQYTLTCTGFPPETATVRVLKRDEVRPE